MIIINIDKTMENNEEVVDKTTNTSSEDVKDEEKNSEADTKDWKAEALKYKAIAERKEKKLQNSQAQSEVVEDKQNNKLPSEEILEEIYLAAGGMSKEDVENLKVIAKGKGITLAEAQKDPIFETLRKTKEQENTKKRASLGASYSNVSVVENNGNSREEKNKKLQEIIQKVNKK